MGYDCDGFEKNENMRGENIKKDAPVIEQGIWRI
jgi:hypothetical protein